jgi:c-di-GMP-related signal transduction protein
MQYVARQPILDQNRCLTGFELLFRDSEENRCPPGDLDVASKKTIDTAMLVGFETLGEGHSIFLNCTEQLIVDGLPTLFPSDTTVVEVLETARPTQQLVKACEALKRIGYRIALDDFVEQPGYDSMIALADVIKVDLRATSPESWPSLTSKYLREHRQFLAEKVETEEEFQAAIQAGFTLFQGYFFSKPIIISTSSINGIDANHLRVLTTLSSPTLNLIEVEAIVKSDPALCYRLLRFLNSPSFYFQEEIRSVLHALMLLGEVELRKWMIVVCAISAGAHAAKKHLLKTALVRGKFGESLAPSMELSSSAFFLLGVLSLMPAILDLPIEDVAERVAVSSDVKAALLGNSNSLRQGFELVLAYEEADWNRCDELRRKWHISAKFLAEAYLASIQSAKLLTDGTA